MGEASLPKTMPRATASDRGTVERTLFELQHGIWDLDVAQQDCYVSAGWWCMLGYDRPPQRLPFTALEVFVHPLDRQPAQRALELSLAQHGPSFDLLLRLQHQDQSYRWIRSRGHPVRNAAGQTIRLVGVNSDVTAQQNTKERLLRSKAFNDKLIAVSLDGIVAVDREGCITAFNPAMVKMWGRAEHEVLGAKVGAAFPFLMHAPCFAAFSQALDTSKDMSWRGAYVHARTGVQGLYDASFVPLTETDGTSLGGLMRVCEASATARHQHQSQLLLDAEETLARPLPLPRILEEVVTIASSALCAWSVILWGSSHLLPAQGDQRGAMLAGAHVHREKGRSLEAWLRGPREQLTFFDGHALENPADGFCTEYLEHVPMGLRSLISPSVKNLGLGSYMRVPLLVRGSLAGTLTLASEGQTLDSFARTLAEMLAQRAAMAIDHAQLLAQASEAARVREHVMSRLSLNLMAPLQRITDHTRDMDTNADETKNNRRPSQMSDLAQSITHSAARMKTLVAGILDLANISRGRYPLNNELMHLSAVAAGSVEHLRPAAEDRGVTLRLEMAATLPPISGDRARLTQVVTNLIDNAIKFSEPDSHVTVAVDAPKDQMRLTVTDEGIGIDPAMQPHLFDRLWQSPTAKRQGSGLGLYIARGIVEAHRGHIEVASRVQGVTGTTFTIVLPTPATASSGSAPQRQKSLSP